MSEAGNAGLPQEMPDATDMPVKKKAWPRAVLLGGAVAAGIALGAGGLAGAAVMGDQMGWHGHGPRLERIQNFVRMALDSVAATSDQEARVHDIVAAAFTDMAPKPGDRAAFGKQAIDLLRAPTIDKAAIEKMRSDFVSREDAKSKRFIEAVLQAADVLTPDQRARLADRADFWVSHHPMMGGGHGWHHSGDGDHHSNRSGPDDNQGPDND